MTSVTINLYDHRPHPEDKTWELPPWGHVLSKGVLPLFMRVEGVLLPIGTAFWVGGGVPLVMTAFHNVVEALRHEPRYRHLLSTGSFPEKVDLKNVGFYVLHQDDCRADAGRLTLLPLESINAGPPGDVVFGYPQFEPGRATWSLPLSFEPPRIGESVWSLGYTGFQPAEGIPLESIRSGEFDWTKSYRHRFMITEGTVGRIFTQRFAEGFNGGPCFSFSNEIEHGQSGGPIITMDGRVVGLNSATATNFFNAPTSLGSMFYPLLMTPIKFGLSLGGGNFSLRLNAAHRLIDLISRGAVKTDGSEQQVALHTVEGKDGYAIGPRIPREDQPFAHADFKAFLDRIPNTPLTEYYRFNLHEPEADSSPRPTAE